MSAQQKARCLMNRSHHNIKHRQQSLLSRTAAEIGVDVDSNYWTTIQGKPTADSRRVYSRSNASMS